MLSNGDLSLSNSVRLLKMDEASSQQALVCMFDVENCIVCFEVSNVVISGYSRLECV